MEEVLPYLVLLVVFLGILALFLMPVSLRFDSEEKYLLVSWLGLSVRKTPGPKKPGEVKKPEKARKKLIRNLARRLLQEKSLILELFQKCYRSAMDLVRSASVREIEASLSLPDPMWNGVISGIFASINIKNVNLSTNFQDINYVRGRVYLFPYSVIKVAASLLIRLPYRRIIRTVMHSTA